MNALQCAAVKGVWPGVARNGQAMPNVLGAFAFRQRIQMEAGDYPLCQLLQVGALQHAAQFRLAYEYDLQQLSRIGFQVGQKAQLLQNIGLQILRLVDDQYTAFAGRVAVQQEGIESVDIVLDGWRSRCHGRDGYMELFTDRLQQFGDRELGVEDVGHMATGWNLLQKAAANRGLASADVAGQQHKAAATTAGRTV